MQVRDAGNLLTRAGLSIPSVDLDETTVHYSHPRQLVQHLRCVLVTTMQGRVSQNRVLR